jgi:HD-GYP domain-containing protein (c-di-GMP phosphodiesterase class II)
MSAEYGYHSSPNESHFRVRNTPRAPEKPFIQEIDVCSIIERIKSEPNTRQLRAEQHIKDPEAVKHQDRATYIAAELAKRAGLPLEELESIIRAVLSHDTDKPEVHGVLSPEEKMKIFRQHPELAAEKMRSIDPRAAHLILVHHEYQNDRYGLVEPNKEDISEQIVAIADQIDALKSARPNYDKLGWSDDSILNDKSIEDNFDYRMVLQALAIWNGENNKREETRSHLNDIYDFKTHRAQSSQYQRAA